MTAESLARLRVRVDAAGAALRRLEDVAPGLPGTLVELLAVVAEEAARTPRFAKNIDAALRGSERPQPPPAPRASAPTRRPKREQGVIDPFAVYRTDGEDGLRSRLGELSIDQLKDIVAEHAMDYDKLAMRWKTASRLHDRIVERVLARETKGDAFR